MDTGFGSVATVISSSGNDFQADNWRIEGFFFYLASVGGEASISLYILPVLADLGVSMAEGYQLDRSSVQTPCESAEGEREKLKRLVDIRPVKALARRRLPARSRLRELILMEEDFLPAWLYVAYVGVWLRLLSLEARGV